MALVVASSCSSDTPTARSSSGASDSSAGHAGSPSSTSAASPCDSGQSEVSSVKHVVWVWMENHTAESVFGAPDAPVETTLKDQCGSSSAYQSVGSPSLPNYVGAPSGDTRGIADDAPPTN